MSSPVLLTIILLFAKLGILGPVAIVSNSLLLLLPTDSTQRSILCGLLIQVWAIGHNVSSLIGHADA